MWREEHFPFPAAVRIASSATMAPAAGTHLGHFEVVTPLGAGVLRGTNLISVFSDRADVVVRVAEALAAPPRPSTPAMPRC
jgi:hypothetical protein